jgi:hypothetical protein
MRSYEHFVYRLTPNIGSFGWDYVQDRTDVPAVVSVLCARNEQFAVDARAAADLLRWMAMVGWAERHVPVLIEPLDGAAPVQMLLALSVGMRTSQPLAERRSQSAVVRLAGLRLRAFCRRALSRSEQSAQGA